MKVKGLKKCPVCTVPKKSLTGIKNIFFLTDAMMNPLNTWKAKLERTYYFKFHFVKITMWLWYNHQKKKNTIVDIKIRASKSCWNQFKAVYLHGPWNTQILIWFFLIFFRSILYPSCICVGCKNPGQLHCDWIHGWNYCCDRCWNFSHQKTFCSPWKWMGK